MLFSRQTKENTGSTAFKKNDPFLKNNYRPVSIHPINSKSFVEVLSEHLAEFFEIIFDKFLCALRKGHGCQMTLLKLFECWKLALEQNKYLAALLMDLSKAFDCLPHDILM